jgi:hypothetical protein
MGARWYDQSIGRFVQPDTIIPNLYNPQNLNRYAYALNNPVKYRDPSGHASCEDADCELVRYTPDGPLHARNGLDHAARSILADLGGINDLEAFALIAEIVASKYPTWDKFLPEMSKIFNGTDGYGPFSLAIAGAYSASIGGCGGIGRETHDCQGNAGKPQFSDKGFHPDYRDGHNQPYHAWGYIAQAANPGGSWLDVLEGVVIGAGGNWFHELIQSKASGLEFYGAKPFEKYGWGTSWQDFVLSDTAMGIGLGISAGNINPSELPNIMRREFGPNSSGSNGKLQELTDRYGPLAGSP